MSGGLFALLDDVAALARLAAASIDDVGVAAAKTSVKAAGVVVDDAAVTPRYVHGLAANRELPIIRKIATGSIRNKLLIILPAVLALSQFLPQALTPLLMIGGSYLCYEGAEKVWEWVRGEGGESEAASNADVPEKSIVSGAVRTDLILSAEIMVIALNEVVTQPLLTRAMVLIVVAFLMTAVVYGAVAIIVKMDDVGLALAQRSDGAMGRFGCVLVGAMPKVLSALSIIGVVAMLWVGGHLILLGTDALGWHGPYALLHSATEAVSHATGALGGFFGWLTDTAISAVVGLFVGAIIVAVMHVIPRRGHSEPAARAAADTTDAGSSSS